MNDDTTITFYDCGHCPQCKATRTLLDRLGVEYRHRAVDPDDPATVRTMRRETGFTVPPIVARTRGATTDAFTGYRPDLIHVLAH